MCQARQYSDQMMCDRCGYVWDMNDIDPPICKTQSEIGNEFLSEAKDFVLNKSNKASISTTGTKSTPTAST